MPQTFCQTIVPEQSKKTLHAGEHAKFEVAISRVLPEQHDMQIFGGCHSEFEQSKSC